MQELRAWFVVPAVLLIIVSGASFVLGSASSRVEVPMKNKTMRPAIGETDTSFNTNPDWHIKPARDTIVAYTVPGKKEPLVARVVALAGDRVKVVKRSYHVNGKPIPKSKRQAQINNAPEVIVPRGCVFLLVDSGRASDSASLGPIPSWRVIGSLE